MIYVSVMGACIMVACRILQPERDKALLAGALLIIAILIAANLHAGAILGS